MILNDIGQYIAANIGQHISSDCRNNGFGFMQSDSKVVHFDIISGERQNIGLNDSINEMCYIRTLSDNINGNLTQPNKGSCTKNYYVERSNLRCVCAIEHGNASTILARMQHGLIAIQSTLKKATSVKIKNAEIEIKTKHFVTESVVKMESNSETWNNNITVVAIDFVLSYEYQWDSSYINDLSLYL